MVANDGCASGRNRGQLFLVGAVAIAMIILGIVVVINTVLFTESVTTGTAIESTTDAAEFDRNARRNVRSLVLRVNHQRRNVDEDWLAPTINESIADYSALLAESYASQRPTLVNITYHNGSSEWGQRLVQTEDARFRSPDGDNNWSVIPPHEATDVGRFVLNLNVSMTAGSRTNISISNSTTPGSDDYVNVSVKRVGGAGGDDILVSAERSFGGNTSDFRCDPSGNRVLLDLMEGTSFTDDTCEFKSVTGLEPPYTIAINEGQNAFGKFSLVTNGTVREYEDPFTRSYAECQFFPNGNDPCRVDAVWATNVTVSYHSETVDFRQQHNVSVYP